MEQLIEVIRYVWHAPYIRALGYVALIDIIIGHVKAFKLEELSSDIGLTGIIKHSKRLAGLPLIHAFLMLGGMPYVGMSIIAIASADYAISIVENFAEMGFINKTYVKMLAKFKGNSVVSEITKETKKYMKTDEYQEMIGYTYDEEACA